MRCLWQLAVEWLAVDVSARLKQPGREADQYPRLLPRLRNSGPLPPLHTVP